MASDSPDLQVYSVSFQALDRALDEALTPALKERFRELGVDFDFPLKKSYPLAVWAQALSMAAEVLHPQLPDPERHLALGKRILDTFGETIVGSVLLAAARVLGTRRMLDRAAHNMRQANNFTEVLFEDPAPRHVVLRFNRVSSPEFYRGLLLRGLELTRATNPTVSYERLDGEKVAYTVRWD